MSGYLQCRKSLDRIVSSRRLSFDQAQGFQEVPVDTLPGSMAIMKRLLDRLDALDASFGAGPPTLRWSKRGGASRYERWLMRRPLQAFLTMYGIGHLLILAVDLGRGAIRWPLHLAYVVVVLLSAPVAYRQNQRLRRLYADWRGQHDGAGHR